MPTGGQVQHSSAVRVVQLPAEVINSSLQTCHLPHHLVLGEAVHVASTTAASPLVGLRSEPLLESSTEWSNFGLKRGSAALFVGHARQRANRTARKAGGAAAQQRTARRCVGARLQQAAPPEMLATPYDPSRLRIQIQLGLRTLSRSGSDSARQVTTRSSAEGSKAGGGVFLQCDHIEEGRSM